MADRRQFGNPKVFEFGDRIAGNQPDGGHCAQCEAMLADALDGTLSAADQEIFDVHMAKCGPCSQTLADARRGAAWLEMLRDPRPEPTPALLERILAQTSGAEAVPDGMQPAGFAGASPVPIAALAPGYGSAGSYGNVLPFPARVAAAFRRSGFGQIMLQPRLAMTAAMAFFSIALTLNLTGVRLQDLRASDLRPSSLRRDFYSERAQVERYYENLRVVYELESRVHDLQSATDNGDSGSQSAPQSASPNPQASPDGQAPEGHPNQPGPTAPPEQRQRPAAKPAPNSGTSRFERTGHLEWVAAATGTGYIRSSRMDAGPMVSEDPSDERVEGPLV